MEASGLALISGGGDGDGDGHLSCMLAAPTSSTLPLSFLWREGAQAANMAPPWGTGWWKLCPSALLPSQSACLPRGYSGIGP